tara:strand:- start:2832 stop:3803 length:972 start_codon:yes stop_codon:yes gene_type:complete
MRLQRLFVAFILITTLGIFYDKYREKYDPDPEKLQFDLVQEHLLENNGNLDLIKKPIMWVHVDHNKNSRHWESFYSRTNNNLNQPYLNMCVETIIKHCGDSFNICLINDNSFFKLLNNWTIDLDKLPEPLKSRTRFLGILKLLKKYGGVTIPNSMLMMKNFIKCHKKYLGVNGIYVGEFISRNVTSTQKRTFPSHRLIGCEKNNNIINDMCSYMEVLLSTDTTSEVEFDGKIDRMLFKHVNSSSVNLIPARQLGMKTQDGYDILLDDLLQNTKINFDKNMVAIYLPKEELLKRTNYKWFLTSNKMQILTSKTVVSSKFTESYN